MVNGVPAWWQQEPNEIQTVNAVRLTAHEQTKRSRDNAVRMPNPTESKPTVNTQWYTVRNS
eukprot:scaffold94151_cov57-Attheya_sp.AAC.3